MTLHTTEWHRAQRSEVILPNPYGLAAVVVIGLFAMSLSFVGLGYQITRIWRKK